MRSIYEARRQGRATVMFSLSYSDVWQQLGWFYGLYFLGIIGPAARSGPSPIFVSHLVLSSRFLLACLARSGIYCRAAVSPFSSSE